MLDAGYTKGRGDRQAGTRPYNGNPAGGRSPAPADSGQRRPLLAPLPNTLPFGRSTPHLPDRRALIQPARSDRTDPHDAYLAFQTP
jgi:hypothetical protein